MPTDSTETLRQRYQREAEIDRQIQLWEGWRDVRVHGYPEPHQSVLFVSNGIVVLGCYSGMQFWHGGVCSPTLWRPMPDPLPADVHAKLVAEAMAGKS